MIDIILGESNRSNRSFACNRQCTCTSIIARKGSVDSVHGHGSCHAAILHCTLHWTSLIASLLKCQVIIHALGQVKVTMRMSVVPSPMRRRGAPFNVVRMFEETRQHLLSTRAVFVCIHHGLLLHAHHSDSNRILNSNEKVFSKQKGCAKSRRPNDVVKASWSFIKLPPDLSMRTPHLGHTSSPLQS